uniref:Uncharacterized protein n=1 Tax=Candidatus Methanogaster sp. ANME-2c ERB4 TaxID=2759911 RepID=A0A7G9YDK9_9EURY|nr:hypothetical protein FAKCHJAF_00030 [Methanosarcinales archaeon ANME-2c ERB4]QNO48832.1 hypothetical protein LEJCPHKL_00001 [Methanosarcinales archaeon ANME-2c ERB4]
MVGKTIGKAIESKEVPVYISRFGRTIEDIFVTSTELKHRFGADFEFIPAGAIGLYTYMQRIAQGMRQLMAGNRKFGLSYIERGDIAALTKDAAEISGIPALSKNPVIYHRGGRRVLRPFQSSLGFLMPLRSPRALR